VNASAKRKALSTIIVARMLGVSVSSVAKWIDEGKLKAGRTPGGHRRIEAEDLVAFLRHQKLPVPDELRPEARRILIVDDEKSFAKWLAEEIRERYPEIEVIQAHDGFSAGEIIGLKRPAVVILDLHMPGMDGFEVCHRIKSNPLIQHTKVIAVSADTSPAARSRILKLGASACIEKPMTREVVLAEIAKSLGLLPQADAAK
jgi:excisionase family DNA binding protein